MGNYKYLICVSAKNKETGEAINNNKFYEMKENDDGTFTSYFGRIGEKPQIKSYSMDRWDGVYKQKTTKVRNGYIYKDMTHIKSTTKTSTFKDVSDSAVMSLLSTLQNYSNKSLIDNYTVSSDAVTMVQIDSAQDVLNNISKLVGKRVITNDEIDEQLMDLYSIIPRKMKTTRDFVLNGDGDKKKAKAILQREQDAVDVMRGQVSISSTADGDEEQTLEDVLGVKISKVKDDKVINTITDLMGDESRRFKNAYEVIKSATQEAFEKQKKESVKHWTRLLWHGSRNENWLNILKTGMKIRPAGAVITGAMFGYGVYWANRCRKSIGYTSLSGSYWAGGNSSRGFLALFDVNTGMELRTSNHESWMYSMDYKKLRAKGDYDSLYALKGADLYNDEFITYKENQCTIKYLVEIN